MNTLNIALLFSLSLFFPIISIAADDKNSVAVNIDAAYYSGINDGWARYVFWHLPDGNIAYQHRPYHESGNVSRAVIPKENSPLAAVYRPNGKFKEADDILLSYLDKDSQIIDVHFRYQDGSFVDWRTDTTPHKSASGLAIASLGDGARRFYIDDEGSVVEAKNNKDVRLDPGTKAAKGSLVSATVPVGSADIHVFFISEDLSLSSITFNGTGWSEVLPPIPNFTSKAGMGFSAVAWSNPLIIRVFSIDEHKLANEWTFESGSWSNTTDSLPITEAAVAGEPVAASRSSNSSGRYIEYFYTAPGGRVNYLARNSAEEAFFHNDLAVFELPQPKPSLSTGDIIGIVTAVITLISVLGCLRSARRRKVAKQWLKSLRHRDKKFLGFSNSSPRGRENKGSEGSEGNSDPESLPLPARHTGTL